MGDKNVSSENCNNLDSENKFLSNEEENDTNEIKIKIADILSCLNPDNVNNLEEMSISNDDSSVQELGSEKQLCEKVLKPNEMLGSESSKCTQLLHSNCKSIIDKDINKQPVRSTKELPNNKDLNVIKSMASQKVDNLDSSKCSSSSAEVSFTDMSESLSNLLTAIENENCNGSENEAAKSQNDSTSDSNTNFEELVEPSSHLISITKEDLDTEVILKNTTISNGDLLPNSKRKIDEESSSDSSLPPSKKIRLNSNDEGSTCTQPTEDESNVEDNQILKGIKVEDPQDDHATVEDWRTVYIKREADGNSLENSEESATEEQTNVTSTLQPNAEHTVKHSVDKLPAYLTAFTRLKSSVVVMKDRSLANGEKVKVKCLKFPRLVYLWIFKDTYLSNFDRCTTLRQNMDTSGTPFVYVDSTTCDLYPVDIGPSFPFGFPTINNQISNKLYKELSPPLSQLASKNPGIVSPRQCRIDGKIRTIPVVNFSEDAIDSAFKESLLSKFSDAPHATDILNVENSWPECSFEALDDVEVDYKFPFAFSDSYKEKAFFEPLDVSLPSSMFKEGYHLPPVTPLLKKKYYIARSFLLRILATASYYIYSASLAELEGKDEKCLTLNSIVCSLHPLAISHANELGTIIFEIRQYLLSDFTCGDNGLILSLIKGPISFSNYFFGNVRNVEKSMKSRECFLQKK